MRTSRCAGRAPASTRRSIRRSRATDDVAVASPVVEVDVTLRGRDEPLARARRRRVPRRGGHAGARRRQRRPPRRAARATRCFPSAAAARWLGVDAGDARRRAGGLARRSRCASPDAPAPAARLRYAVMDIAAAQDRFDRAGRLTRIDLRLAPGVDRARRRSAGSQALLPPACTSRRPQRARRRDRAALARVSRESRRARAGRAVHRRACSCSRRRRSRCAQAARSSRCCARSASRAGGSSLWSSARRRCSASIGAAIGLAAGYALAWLALRRFGPDLGAGFFRGATSRSSIEPLSLLRVRARSASPRRSLGSFVARARSRTRGARAALKASDADRSQRRARTHGRRVVAHRRRASAPRCCRPSPTCRCSATSRSR